MGKRPYTPEACRTVELLVTFEYDDYRITDSCTSKSKRSYRVAEASGLCSLTIAFTLCKCSNRTEEYLCTATAS